MIAQQTLLDCLMQRFLPSNAVDKSRLNRIRKEEIYDNKTLILASLLDPRFKMRPLLGKL